MLVYPFENAPLRKHMGCRCSRCVSRKEEMLGKELMLLWLQHVYWTRLVISGIVFDSPDLKTSEARLFRNPEDFAEVLSVFYGEEKADSFKKLFTEHLSIAGELVTEAKAGNRAAAEAAERRWYENADQIAAFLASINPYWSMREWREMMYRHLAMTKREAEEFISGEYAASVTTFDMIEKEALAMADRMTRGIAMQFAVAE